MTSSRRYTPALLLLFVGSGCAALIYEVVWFQLLQLVIGSSAISLGVLLGTFMGGMCLGSLLLPRYVSARPASAARVRVARAGHRCHRHARSVRDAAGRRHLYGLGRIGVGRDLPPRPCRRHLPPAADDPDGCDAAGDRALGETTPQGVVVARILLWRQHVRRRDRQPAGRVLSAARARHGYRDVTWPWRSTWPSPPSPSRLRSAAPHEVVIEPVQRKVEACRRSRVVYVAIALSGMTALGAEVIWTRLLSLLFGATTYTFSLILAVFLARVRHRQQRRRGPGQDHRAAAGRARLVPAAAVRRDRLGGLHADAVAAVLADQSIDLAVDPWFNVPPRSGPWPLAMLPAAILWGASFPLALAAVASNGQDPGRLVGGVYAANTVGAIVGALMASLVLVDVARQPARAADAHHHLRLVGAARPRAAAVG